MAKVYIAADHAGFELKSGLAVTLIADGHTVEDLGAHSFEPADDYPQYAAALAARIAAEPEARGFIIGGSGQGEAMAVNRVSGARAAVFYGARPAVAAIEQEGTQAADAYEPVRLARRHNDANVLSLGARFLSADEALEAVRIFLDTPFSGEERHARRVRALH